MLVINSKEFKENQTTYLNQVDKGIEILIRRGRNKSYKIIPVVEDDTLMSKEAFFDMLDEAEKGKAKKLTSEYENFLFGDI